MQILRDNRETDLRYTYNDTRKTTFRDINKAKRR